MNRILSNSLVLALAVAVQSCGSGGSGDPTLLGRSGSDSTRVTISITDAAVTNATEVWVEFSGITMKPADGDAIAFVFDSPRRINLLSLYGSRSEVLISNETVPAGEYDWIRLAVNAEYDGIYDSYIVLDDGTEHELLVVTGSTTGLRINNIPDLQASTPLSLTIDFDLAKSTVLSNGEYSLKPVLRLVEDENTGTINGTVDAGLLVTNCSDSDPTSHNAIYVFEGEEITPDDIDGVNPEPVTVAQVRYNDLTGAYEYEIGFLPEGAYTLALTCQADLDDPEANDAIDFADIRYDVEVEADEAVENVFR